MPLKPKILAHLKAFSRAVLIYAAAFVFLNLAAIVISFPWNVDPQGDESSLPAQTEFYTRVYTAGTGSAAKGSNSAVSPLSDKEQFYVDVARQAAIDEGVPQIVTAFVERYGLQDKKILEVGAGSGLLQDLVADYTALDISAPARRFFHKPFVQASATDMPFLNSSFDAVWSVWVLEHIPNPEKALLEMRRVVRDGGYLLLVPAWEVDRYAAQGYAVRPYKDFEWKGKLWKASIPIARSNVFHFLQYHQVRLLRSLGARLGSGPSRLHFIRLTPNYDQYWVGDSDATTSLSHHEVYLWFTTRGDTCRNCPAERDLVLKDPEIGYLVIQVHKR